MKKLYLLILALGLTYNTFAQSGSSLLFDGINDYVRLNNSLVLSQPYTIETWAKYNDGLGRICAADNNELLIDDWDRRKVIRCYVNGNSLVTSNDIFNYNTWFHVACVVDGANSKIYLNGVEVASGDLGSSSLNATNFDLGKTATVGDQAPLNGQLDEFRIWNTARTATEIKNNYLTEVDASSSGLLVYYKCNEGSGTTLTNGASGGSYNATLNSGTTWVASGANIAVSGDGNALNFDGTDDYVELSSSINLANSSYTLECWFKATTQSGYFMVIGSASGGTRLVTGIKLNPLVPANNDPEFSTPEVPANIQYWMYGDDHYYNWSNDSQWHHVAFTFNSSNQLGTLYLDGTSVASATFGGNMTGSGKARLSASTWATDGFFNGDIDEVRIWNVARTQTEIQNNWSSTIDPTTTGLVAYYRFDEGISSGTNTGVSSLLDLTSYKNNATLNNFALSGSTSNWVLANNSALPVELTSFSASSTIDEVNLQWQTATELNNYGFEVERMSTSLDIAWEKIGFVQGHGNSNSQKSYSFEDASPLAGIVKYRLKQIDFDGQYEYSDIVEVTVDAPLTFALEQNQPNPFNPTTVISYNLPMNANVKLTVYDALGKEVTKLVSGMQTAGNYKINFNGSGLASGVYYYRIQAGDIVQTKKMILMK